MKKELQTKLKSKKEAYPRKQLQKTLQNKHQQL